MEKAPEYKYLKFISYLQIIGIILVVLGHSFHQYPDGEMGRSLWFYQLLYNVRMPMFTFVSGYLMYYTSFVAGRSERSWKDFTVNKIKRLMLPYLTLSLVTFVPRASLSSMADDPMQLNVGQLLWSLVDSESMVIPYFWFLYMSFILLVGSYLVLVMARRLKLRVEIPLLALASLFILLPMVDAEFTSLFAIKEVVRLGIYFTLGIVYCHYSPLIDKHLHTGKAYTALTSAAIWVAMFFAPDDEVVRRVASVFGILAFVALCHIMENKDIRLLDHLRGANYIIFLLSWYVNVATQQVLAHYISLPWWVHTLLSLVGGIYIPYLGLKFLQRHSRSRIAHSIAYLLGQNLNKPIGR